MCEFNLTISSWKNINSLVKKAEETFNQFGGDFSGNEDEGEFNLDSPAGKVSGSYKINNNLMSIVLNEKPTFLPCSVIENEFKKYLSI